MKRVLAILLVLVMGASAATVSTSQVTIGASTTQVATSSTYCRQITFQNNATHVMRVGDSGTTSSKGVLLNAASGSNAGGSWTITTTAPGAALNLADFWVNGTQNDVLDVSCTI